MARIRMLEIISGFAVEGPLGGIERFGIELVRHLDTSRFEPILCGLWRYHAPYEEQHAARLEKEGIRAFFAADWQGAHPYRSFLQAWRGILQHLRGEKVHLIHSHCQFGDVAALLVAHPLRTQVILRTVHNEREWPKRPLRRMLLTNTLYPLLFRLEIGVSQQVTDNLNARFMASLLKRQSVCVHNAIDLHRFDKHRDQSVLERTRKQLGLLAESRVIGTIGRLTHQKGYSLLLKATALVLSQIPSARVLIIGGGELEEELRHLSKELGIEHAVLFLGPRQDTECLLAIMDVFVSSSLWEGLPTAILESMAAKTPVVATDVSGTRELVKDSVTGLLVPPGDPQALAQAILWMLRERERAIAMSERAYLRVQSFSITQVTRQYMKIYQDILSPNTLGSPE